MRRRDRPVSSTDRKRNRRALVFWRYKICPQDYPFCPHLTSDQTVYSSEAGVAVPTLTPAQFRLQPFQLLQVTLGPRPRPAIFLGVKRHIQVGIKNQDIAAQRRR